MKYLFTILQYKLLNMTFIPTPPNPPTSLYTTGVYILQYDNQQVIGSALTPFEFRTGIYKINDYPEVFASVGGNLITTASNDIDNLINTAFGGTLYSTLCFCTLDNPTGNLFPSGMIPYSVYVYTGPDWYNDDPNNPGYPMPYPQLNDWTLVASLPTIGAGAWFTYNYPSSHDLVYDGTQLVDPPISASLSGSYGFVQITSSGTPGTYAKITLTCVETSSTDPAGGKWIISTTDTLNTTTKLY